MRGQVMSNDTSYLIRLIQRFRRVFFRRFSVALLLGLFVMTSPVAGQRRLDLGGAKLCNYYGETPGEALYTFPPDVEAVKFIEQIVRYTGLSQNFKIHAANVRNASATAIKGDRLVLYNQDYIGSVINQTGTNWAAVSIFAHEIGHHLNNHTFGSGLGPEQELEADVYSGNVLFRMGATREQSKAAMESQPEKLGSGPPRSARLSAIQNGWLQAQRDQKAAGRGGEEPKLETEADIQNRDQKAREEAEKRQKEDERLRKFEEEKEERRLLEEERAERRREAEEKQEQEARRARFCCDDFGRKWCRLAVPMEVDEVCSCYNAWGQWIGSGLACR